MDGRLRPPCAVEGEASDNEGQLLGRRGPRWGRWARGDLDAGMISVVISSGVGKNVRSPQVALMPSEGVQ